MPLFPGIFPVFISFIVISFHLEWVSLQTDWLQMSVREVWLTVRNITEMSPSASFCTQRCKDSKWRPEAAYSWWYKNSGSSAGHWFIVFEIFLKFILFTLLNSFHWIAFLQLFCCGNKMQTELLTATDNGIRLCQSKRQLLLGCLCRMAVLLEQRQC